MGRGDYFCGWYFRCQGERDTIALIPAVHRRDGVWSASLQWISREAQGCLTFPYDRCRVEKNRPWAVLGDNWFSHQGIRLDLHTRDLSAEGTLTFRNLTPLRYDIMGPFACLPFLECRHQVCSLGHAVSGRLRVNGREMVFRDGPGYIEGDRGRSFPRHYGWTQCAFPGGGLMLAVAEIPLGPARFTGVTGAVRLGEKEYRLATYWGAKAEKPKDGVLTVHQGELTLTAALLDRSARPLLAPTGGAMSRTIRENVACRAHYVLRRGERVLLDLETEQAAFEYEYP